MRDTDTTRNEAVLVGAIVVATMVWITLFGAGATVETEFSRFILAPLDGISRQLDDKACRRLAFVAGLEVGDSPNEMSRDVGADLGEKLVPNRVGSTSLSPVVAVALVNTVADAPVDKPVDGRQDRLRDELAKWVGSDKPNRMQAFVTCVTCYSPINIALLSIVAGLIGGCSSKLYVARVKASQALGQVDGVFSPQDVTRIESLDENPAISAVRGLVGYILILAGVYAIFDDPFKSPTTSQYTKLAGFASALAFTLGYDGTRLTRLLDSFSTKSSKF